MQIATAFLCREKSCWQRGPHSRQRCGRAQLRLHRLGSRSLRWSHPQLSVALPQSNPLIFRNLFQRGDAFLVVFHCSHGNADPFWQLVAFERSHDNFSREQLLKGSDAVTDIYHHKVRCARNKLEFHLSKLFLEIGAPGIDNTLGFKLVRVVSESSERTGVSDGIDVEWLPRLLKHIYQVSPIDAVADAQNSESVNIRKGAQNDDVPTFANVLECVGRTVEELEIRFVENNNDIFQKARHELVDLVLRNQSAGWIIGIRDENQTRFRRDRIQHRIKVLLAIRTWSLNRVRAEKGRDQFIGDKRVLRRNDVIAAMKKRMS